MPEILIPVKEILWINETDPNVFILLNEKAHVCSDNELLKPQSLLNDSHKLVQDLPRKTFRILGHLIGGILSDLCKEEQLGLNTAELNKFFQPIFLGDESYSKKFLESYQQSLNSYATQILASSFNYVLENFRPENEHNFLTCEYSTNLGFRNGKTVLVNRIENISYNYTGPKKWGITNLLILPNGSAAINIEGYLEICIDANTRELTDIRTNSFIIKKLITKKYTCSAASNLHASINSSNQEIEPEALEKPHALYGRLEKDFERVRQILKVKRPKVIVDYKELRNIVLELITVGSSVTRDPKQNISLFERQLETLESQLKAIENFIPLRRPYMELLDKLEKVKEKKLEIISRIIIDIEHILQRHKPLDQNLMSLIKALSSIADLLLDKTFSKSNEAILLNKLLPSIASIISNFRENEGLNYTDHRKMINSQVKDIFLTHLLEKCQPTSQECLVFQKTYQPNAATNVGDQTKIKNVFQNGLVNYDLAENCETTDPQLGKHSTGHLERMHQFIQSIPKAYRKKISDEAIERWIMDAVGSTTLRAWEETFGSSIDQKKYRFHTKNTEEKPTITFGFDPTLGDTGNLYATTNRVSGAIRLGSENSGSSVATAHAQITCVAELGQDKKLSTKASAYLTYDAPVLSQANEQESVTTSEQGLSAQKIMTTLASYAGYTVSDEKNTKNKEPELPLQARVKQDLSDIKAFKAQTENYNALRRAQKWQVVMGGKPQRIFGYVKGTKLKNHVWKIGLQPEQVQALILAVLEKENKSGGVNFLRLAQANAKSGDIPLNCIEEYEAAERYIAQECDNDPNVLFHLGVTALRDYESWYDDYKLLVGVFDELDIFDQAFKAYGENAFSADLNKRKELLEKLRKAFNDTKKLSAQFPAHLNFGKFEEELAQEQRYLAIKEKLPKHEIIPTEITNKPAVYKASTDNALKVRRKIWQNAKTLSQTHAITPGQLEDAAQAYEKLRIKVLENKPIEKHITDYLRDVLKLDKNDKVPAFAELSDPKGIGGAHDNYQRLKREKQDVYEAYLALMVIEVLKSCHKENELSITDYLFAWNITASIIEGDENRYTHTAKWDKLVKNPLCESDSPGKMKRYSIYKPSLVFAQKLIQAEKVLRGARAKEQNRFVTWVKKNLQSKDGAFGGNYTVFHSDVMYKNDDYIKAIRHRALLELEFAKNEKEVDSISENYRLLEFRSEILSDNQYKDKFDDVIKGIRNIAVPLKKSQIRCLEHLEKNKDNFDEVLNIDGKWDEQRKISFDQFKAELKNVNRFDAINGNISHAFQDELLDNLRSTRNKYLKVLFEKAVQQDLKDYEQDVKSKNSFNAAENFKKDSAAEPIYKELKKIYEAEKKPIDENIEEVKKQKEQYTSVIRKLIKSPNINGDRQRQLADAGAGCKRKDMQLRELTSQSEAIAQKLNELEKIYTQAELKKENLKHQRIKALRQAFTQKWAKSVAKGMREQNNPQSNNSSKQEELTVSLEKFAELVSPEKLEKAKSRMEEQLQLNKTKTDKAETKDVSAQPLIADDNEFKDPIQQKILDNLKNRHTLPYEAMRSYYLEAQRNYHEPKETLPQAIGRAAMYYQSILAAEKATQDYLKNKLGFSESAFSDDVLILEMIKALGDKDLVEKKVSIHEVLNKIADPTVKATCKTFVSHIGNNKVGNAYKILCLAYNLRGSHGKEENSLENYRNTWNEIARLCGRNNKRLWYHTANTWRTHVTEKLTGTAAQEGDDTISRFKTYKRNEPRILVTEKKEELSEVRKRKLRDLSSNAYYYLKVTEENQKKVYTLFFCKPNFEKGTYINVIDKVELKRGTSDHNTLLDYFESGEEKRSIEGFITTQPKILAAADNIVKANKGYTLPEGENTLPRSPYRFSSLDGFAQLRDDPGLPEKAMLSPQLAEKSFKAEKDLITQRAKATWFFVDPGSTTNSSFSSNERHYLRETFIEGVLRMMSVTLAEGSDSDEEQKALDNIHKQYKTSLKNVTDQQHILISGNKSKLLLDSESGNSFYVKLLDLAKEAKQKEMETVLKIYNSSVLKIAKESKEELESGIVKASKDIDSQFTQYNLTEKQKISEKIISLSKNAGLNNDDLLKDFTLEERGIAKNTIESTKIVLSDRLKKAVEIERDRNLRKLFDLLQESLLGQSYDNFNYLDLTTHVKSAFSKIENFAPNVKKDFLLNAKQQLKEALTKKQQERIKVLKRKLKDKISIAIETFKLEAEQLLDPNTPTSGLGALGDKLINALAKAYGVIYHDGNQELVDSETGTLERIQDESVKQLNEAYLKKEAQLLSTPTANSSRDLNQTAVPETFADAVLNLLLFTFSGQAQQRAETLSATPVSAKDSPQPKPDKQEKGANQSDSFLSSSNVKTLELNTAQFLMMRDMAKKIARKLPVKDPRRTEEKLEKINEVTINSLKNAKTGSLQMFVPSEQNAITSPTSNLSREDSGSFLSSDSDNDLTSPQAISPKDSIGARYCNQFQLFNTPIMKPFEEELLRFKPVATKG